MHPDQANLFAAETPAPPETATETPAEIVSDVVRITHNAVDGTLIESPPLRGVVNELRRLTRDNAWKFSRNVGLYRTRSRWTALEMHDCGRIVGACQQLWPDHEVVSEVDNAPPPIASAAFEMTRETLRALRDVNVRRTDLEPGDVFVDYALIVWIVARVNDKSVTATRVARGTDTSGPHMGTDSRRHSFTDIAVAWRNGEQV